jgi:hypothetical protein
VFNGADVPLNQLSITDLEVCLVRFLAVLSLVFDVIKLASDLVGEELPEARREQSDGGAMECVFVARAIRGSLPRNASVIARYDSPGCEFRKSSCGDGSGQYLIVSLAVLAVAGWVRCMSWKCSMLYRTGDADRDCSLE